MPKSSDLNFYLNDEDLDDDHLEESPNKRWNKLDSEITEQKLLDFDTVHLAIDTERGIELAWNEMIFDKTSNQNRFEDVNTLESIYVRIKYALDLLIKLDHSNFLRYYDYWFVNDESEAKIVVITEYSTAGSLKRALEKSKNSHIKVKEQSSKRWINQIVTAIKYLHSEKISLFQGHLNSEAIFIQNNGVLKVAPTLLLLNGVCEITQNTIKSSTSSLASNKLLTLSKEIIAQDLHAIGRIALDIYNSNFNFKSVHQSPIKSKFHANSEALRAMLNNTNNNENNITQEDNADDINDLQKDFINKCLSVNKSSPINIDTIWNHPFINIIYSLRVLSVFSIFNYFQGQAKFEAKKSNPKTPSLSKISEEKCQNNNESSLVESNSDQISNFRSTSNQSIRLNSTNSSFDKFKEKRKVSLTFLSSFNNLTLPQNFFAILDDIRYGLYPRIFKDTDFSNLSSSNNVSLNNLLQRRQYIDRRCSILEMNNYIFSKSDINESNYVFYNNNNNTSDTNEVFNENSENNVDNEKYFYSNKKRAKEYIEEKRIETATCSIQKEKQVNEIQLSLTLNFTGNFIRKLECKFDCEFLDIFQIDYCQSSSTDYNHVKSNNILSRSSSKDEHLLYFKDEQSLESKLNNICVHLTNELLDYGLINELDHNFVSQMLLKTIISSIESV